MEEDKKLFEEFPPISKQQWETQILKDLKGKGLEEIAWRTDEGFDIAPLYCKEDINDTPIDQLHYLMKKNTNEWEIRQDVVVAKKVEDANKEAVTAITQGATGIRYIVNHWKNDAAWMSLLLHGIDSKKIALHFVTKENPLPLLKLFINEIKKKVINTNPIKGSIEGYKEEEHSEIMTLLAAELPNFHGIHVEVGKKDTIVEELAHTLAKGNQHLGSLTDKGLSVDNIAPHLKFSLGIGSSFFMEIAKLRAARLLWANVVAQYQPTNSNSLKTFIHVHLSHPAELGKGKEQIVNTTQLMSAIIGGADSISIETKDVHLQERINRNIQLILKEEAHLNQVVDPSSGSYYIEVLTNKIAEQAWKVFQKIC